MVISFPVSPSRLALAVLFGFATFALQADPLSQPVAPVRPVTDTYFGTKVVDPYRWMEDLKSPEMQGWMKAQNDYTRDFLGKLPGREALIKRVLDLDNASTRIGSLCILGDRYFYFKVTAKDQTPKLYARDGVKGEERLLVDPQVLGNLGLPPDAKPKRYTITDYYPSPDGKLVGVEVAAGGSEEGVVRVLDA